MRFFFSGFTSATCPGVLTARRQCPSWDERMMQGPELGQEVPWWILEEQGGVLHISLDNTTVSRKQGSLVAKSWVSRLFNLTYLVLNLASYQTLYMYVKKISLGSRLFICKNINNWDISIQYLHHEMVVKYDMQCHRLISEMSKYLPWGLWIEFTF